MQNNFSSELSGDTTSAMPDTFPQWKEDCIRTHSLPFSEQRHLALGPDSSYWLHLSSGQASHRPSKAAKQKNIPFFLFLIWAVINYDRGHSGSMRCVVYAHHIKITLCKCNQSQQCQELCLSRMWAEAAYPCSHERLNPEASPTHISLVCQRSCGPFGGWTTDGSTTKESGSGDLIGICHF